MSDFQDELQPEPVDQRPLIISACFVTISLCASLFIYMLLENQSTQSFMQLHDVLAQYTSASAAAMFTMFVAAMASVVAIWLQHRTGLKFLTMLMALLLAAFAVIIAFVASLHRGAWNDDLKRAFKHRNSNESCPTLADDSTCCGWDQACPIATCPQFNATCAETIRSEIKDFFVRVMPMVCLASLSTLVAVVVAPITLRQWALQEGDTGSEAFDESFSGGVY